MSMGFKGDLRPALRCGESRVKQEFAKRSDIRDIVARYKKTGMVDHVARQRPVFADVAEMPDFRTAMDKVALASQSFDMLPASIRNRFHNDPASLVEFMKDGKNRDEAIKLGLIPKPKEKEPEAAPTRVVVVNPDSDDSETDSPPSKSKKK